MKIPLLLLCLLFFSTHLVQAQKAPVIQGHVFDDTWKPLGYANVVVSKGGIKVTGASTQPDGSYKIIPPDTGIYTIKASYVAFKSETVILHITIGDSVIQNISFKESPDLSTVCLMARPPIVDKGKTVFCSNIETKNVRLFPRDRDSRKRSRLSAAVRRAPAVNGNGESITLRASRGKTDFQSSANDFRDYKDNDFLSVRSRPFSTFSIDVDKASYALVKKCVYASEDVPRGMVRAEELINYFHYDYPQPEDEHPFRIIHEVSECLWNKDSRLVKIALQGKHINAAALPPSVFTFLIDVSGSMDSPDKLPLVKSSLQKLLDQLRPQDKVGLVVYAGAAGLVLEPVSAAERGLIMEKILALDAGGSTAGGEGIQLAYSLAEKHFVKGGNNRIILCTDGDFNVGVQSDSDLTALIEEQREKGIFLTALGYGMGNYKDGRLEMLADKGNGNYAYINSYDEALKFLGKEFSGSMYAIAKDVKIQVEFNPAVVKSYRLIGYENRLLKDEDFNNDKVDAGEIGVGHTVTAIYEIRTDEKFSGTVDEPKYSKNSIKEGHKEIATVKFRYKEPDGKQSKLIVQEIPDITHKWAETSAESRVAICVAAFAQVLRGSEYVKELPLPELIRETRQLARQSSDKEWSSFVELMEKYAQPKKTIK